jgi:cell division protein FtsA
MPAAPVVALEIGTSKVIALVAEMREDGCVMITGLGEEKAVNVRKGEITDLESVSLCVRSVLEGAEESGNVAIGQVHLAVSGGHVQSQVNRGSVPVLDPDGEITREDMDQVMAVAKAVHLPPDREILHTVCQHYSVDDHVNVVNPEGMTGARLSLDMLVVYGLRSCIQNTIKAVSGLSVEVTDVAFSGLCSALSVLTAEQKKSGVVVIDLGGGTTDYVAYAGNVVAVGGAIGVGGDHVTNDLALAFTIPVGQAEKLKREHGSAVIDPGQVGKRVSLPADVGFSGCTISMRSMHTVINARMTDTFELVRKRLDADGFLHHVGAGVVLTGGGAHLRGVTELAEKVFGLPCTVGKPRNVSGLATASEGPEYATCSGLAQYAFMTLYQDDHLSFGDWFKRLFGR